MLIRWNWKRTKYRARISLHRRSASKSSCSLRTFHSDKFSDFPHVSEHFSGGEVAAHSLQPYFVQPHFFMQAAESGLAQLVSGPRKSRRDLSLNIKQSLPSYQLTSSFLSSDSDNNSIDTTTATAHSSHNRTQQSHTATATSIDRKSPSSSRLPSPR